MFEKFFFNKLFKFLDDRNALSKQQSGFRLGNLCIYQLLAITPNIFSKFDCYPTLEARSVFLTYLKRLIEFDPIDYYSN